MRLILALWSTTGNCMTKEQIEKRIAELQKQIEQVNANGNALMGAIQDCQYWLAQLDKPEEEPK